MFLVLHRLGMLNILQTDYSSASILQYQDTDSFLSIFALWKKGRNLGCAVWIWVNSKNDTSGFILTMIIPGRKKNFQLIWKSVGGGGEFIVKTTTKGLRNSELGKIVAEKFLIFIAWSKGHSPSHDCIVSKTQDGLLGGE